STARFTMLRSAMNRCGRASQTWLLRPMLRCTADRQRLRRVAMAMTIPSVRLAPLLLEREQRPRERIRCAEDRRVKIADRRRIVDVVQQIARADAEGQVVAVRSLVSKVERA